MASVMTSSAVILMWESWMLTRWGFLSRLLVAFAFMVLIGADYESIENPTEGDLRAIRLSCFWVSILCSMSGLSLNHSQDNRGGFPFFLGYTRPAPTWLLIVVPMAYRALYCTVLYLLPLLTMHFIYGMPFLTIAASLLVIPISLMINASSWWTDKQGVSQLIGWSIASCLAIALSYYTLHFDAPPDTGGSSSSWWDTFRYSRYDYLVVLLASVSAVVLTFAGVERQRHSDDEIGLWPLKNADEPGQSDAEWLAELYETECPTTSAKRAELWYEITGTGMPLIVWSIIVALCIPMLWFLCRLFESEVAWSIGTFMALLVPLIKSTPTFGIVVKQGSAYLSTFAATRPLGSAWLAGLKIGVAIIAVTVGMFVIAVSFWFSAPLVDGFIEGVDVIKVAAVDYVQRISGIELAAIVFVRMVQLSTMVACLATFQAIYVLYSDRLTFGILGLIIYACILPPFIAAKVLPLSFALAHLWIGSCLIAAGSIWLIYSLARHRIMSILQISAFVSIWILYAVAYFYLLGEDGLYEGDTPKSYFAFQAGLCLSSLAICAMAPWSLAMIRHR